MSLTTRAAVGHFVFTAFAFACLAYAFLNNDFSVLYVAQNSNSELPTFYRFAAVWGAHEGSLVLWLLVQSIWTFSVVLFSRNMPDAVTSRVIGVLGLISAGFALFILTTSSPFERLWPAAVDGRDLNPLLQDPGLVIHPPMQYTGYVGMSVPFAFAVAAMLEGKLDSIWARWVRPWATAAWMFLTIGITLGSWWAYYELGWGGWWFWDPVENASFMPWLIGTALIHSLAVTEKRGLFKSWTLLLAITGFSLSVLGTFLVRSGVIESVHAFASDPERGLFILVFLGLCVRRCACAVRVARAAVSFERGLCADFARIVSAAEQRAARRGDRVDTARHAVSDVSGCLQSRQDFGWAAVLHGRFSDSDAAARAPACARHARLVEASVVRASQEAAGHTAARRRRARTSRFQRAVYGWRSVLTVVGVAGALWVAFSSLIEPVERLRKGHSLSAGVVGMCVAHFGLALFVLGATTVESWRQQMDLSLKPGQSAEVGGFQFAMTKLERRRGTELRGRRERSRISRDGKQVAVRASAEAHLSRAKDADDRSRHRQ